MDANTAFFFQISNLSQKSPVLDTLMIFGAEYLIFIVVFLSILLFFMGKAKEKRAAILAVFALVMAFLLVKFIRMFYFEPRPFVTFPIIPLINHAADAAFPSVHTTILATFVFAYTYYKSKLAPLFLVSMLWTGFARIFVGVHYPLDILGGISVGFLSIFLTTTFLTTTILKKLSKF